MSPVARRALVTGIVQGVGFRPSVARLAMALELAGTVRNAAGRVIVEIEGPPAAVAAFIARLPAEAPVAARIDGITWEDAPAVGRRGFEVVPSDEGASGQAAIPPDLAPCPACLAEVDALAGRRAGYAFTTCTDCGPRYTAAASLPWDRPRTTLAAFPLCAPCAAEYGDAADRRFHAETLACPACGPSLRLLGPDGAPWARGAEALAQAVAALRRGGLLALKGIGGFQLLVDARDGAAVARLREAKRRPSKPLAVMVGDLHAARRVAAPIPEEADALSGPSAPIVLCAARSGAVAPAVAPGLRRLGLMLPASPLHHLLARAFDGPLVCTSGNLHDDPMVVDEGEAVGLLGPRVDALLTHDRPIQRRADDSVLHVVLGRPRALRVGRGLTPLIVDLGAHRPELRAAPPLLAVGGHLEQAPALLVEGRLTQWAHGGTLDSPAARRALDGALDDLCAFVGAAPRRAACDAHPDYATTRWVAQRGLDALPVHHHHAHIASVLAEHGRSRGLGVAWDGLGLGPDDGLWGGELLDVAPGRPARRVGHLRPFPLPGGDAAARDGRRALAGVLASLGLAAPSAEVETFMGLARSPRLAPATTSAGRLFDAAAAALGVATRSDYQGHAAILLQEAAEGHGPAEPFPWRLGGDGVLDHGPMWPALLAGRADPARAAARFHATLAALLDAAVARLGAESVALSGGCFANRLLVERCVERLAGRGVEVLLPTRLPPGDGGLALGQAAVAVARLVRGAPQVGGRA